MITETFSFTQNNLQNFIDCEYRFYLQEILHLEWPGVESEPIRKQEELMQLGSKFHLLCQQYLSGIPENLISAQVSQPQLLKWWNHFLALGITPTKNDYWVEKMISIPYGDYRLAGKFDLILTNPSGMITIYDWKTSLHQPKRLTLQQRMQSKVYPFIVAQSAKPIVAEPENINMVYWYPEFPDSPIQFKYSKTQFESDRQFLKELSDQILNKKIVHDFARTKDEKKCSYCRYRSLCDKGVAAGTNEETDIDPEMDDAFNLDFDL